MNYHQSNNYSSSNYQQPDYGKKGQRVIYDPDSNTKNIFMRKLNRQRQLEQQQLTHNPLNDLLQPHTHITKSKRFIHDKLDVSDIPKVKPDVYGAQRHIEGRSDYLNTEGIKGAQPSHLKQNMPRQGPDFKLYDKDINPEKWITKRTVNPLLPEYEVPTKSGRIMKIGHIERSTPQPQVSTVTRRVANFVTDIDGTKPKQLYAITEQQRQEVMSNKSQLPYFKNHLTRNKGPGIFENITAPSTQFELLQEAKLVNDKPPASHYAKFAQIKQAQSNSIIPTVPMDSFLLQNGGNSYSYIEKPPLPPNIYQKASPRLESPVYEKPYINNEVPDQRRSLIQPRPTRILQVEQSPQVTNNTKLEQRDDSYQDFLTPNKYKQDSNKRLPTRNFMIQQSDPMANKYVPAINKNETQELLATKQIDRQHRFLSQNLTNVKSLQSTLLNHENNRIPTITQDQQAHLSHLQSKQANHRNEEVWSTARKLNHDVSQNQLKVTTDNQRGRLSDIHQKYIQLNNNVLNFKLNQQVVNPINHQVTFSGKDLIARSELHSIFATNNEVQQKNSFDFNSRSPQRLF